MTDDPDLAAYQESLLALLHDETSPAAVKDALARHPELASFRAYVLALEPRSLEVAMELVRKWSEVGPQR